MQSIYFLLKTFLRRRFKVFAPVSECFYLSIYIELKEHDFFVNNYAVYVFLQFITKMRSIMESVNEIIIDVTILLH